MDRLSSLAILLLSCVLYGASAKDTAAAPSGNWYVTDPATKNVCVLATFDANFTVGYIAFNSTLNTTYTSAATITIPKSASVNADHSFCSQTLVNNTQTLALRWGTTYKYNLTLMFVQLTASNQTLLQNVTLQYDLADRALFPNANETVQTSRTAANLGSGAVAIIDGTQYLQCDSGVTVELTNVDGVNTLKTLGKFNNAKMQAFRQTNSTDFQGDAEVCAGDRVPTSPAPSTTPVPPHVPVYNVTDLNGHVCLLAAFDLSVAVIYHQALPDNKTQDVNATATGVNHGNVNHGLSLCNETHGILVIEDFVPEWQLSLVFIQNAGKFSLNAIQLLFDLNDSNYFHNATYVGKLAANSTGLTKWQASLGHSYQCKQQDTIDITPPAGSLGFSRVTIYLDEIRVQPFMTNVTEPRFGDAEVCTTETSDIVPIAVGCALAALVVIVLIAYVIGRRRNRARGYESM